MKKEKEFQLYQIAEDQGGYFSLPQAYEIGLQRSQIYRGLDRGVFIKTGWGIYRFKQFPATRFEEIHIAVLAAGQQVVVGFQTALYVYDLSDIIPDEIHLILPSTSSRRRPGIRVHTVQLQPDEITHYDGFRITIVEKTIIDCAFAHVDDEHIHSSITQALQRGLTTKTRLINLAHRRSSKIQSLIHNILEEGHS